MAKKNLKRRRGPVKKQQKLPKLVLEAAQIHRRLRESSPSLPDVGTELRSVVTRLTRIESYLIVAGLALDGNAGYDGFIRVLLRSAVGNLLFKQIRTLEDLAARCDGGSPSDRDQEDDPDEDEDSGGQERDA